MKTIKFKDYGLEVRSDGKLYHDGVDTEYYIRPSRDHGNKPKYYTTHAPTFEPIYLTFDVLQQRDFTKMAKYLANHYWHKTQEPVHTNEPPAAPSAPTIPPVPHLFQGKLIYPPEIPSDLSRTMVINELHAIVRWPGSASLNSITVAEHSLFAYTLWLGHRPSMEHSDDVHDTECGLAILLHDVAEIFTGDIPRSIKKSGIVDMEKLSYLESKIHENLLAHFDLPLDLFSKHIYEIKFWDDLANRLERNKLMGHKLHIAIDTKKPTLTLVQDEMLNIWVELQQKLKGD